MTRGLSFPLLLVLASSHLPTLSAAVPTSQAAPAAINGELPSPPDYSLASMWACRPDDTGGPCTGNLDAVRLSINGSRKRDPFRVAVNAPIDCFYVYPTVSTQETDYARPIHEPSVDAVVHSQAARLRAQCAVYAPLYRQLTGPGLTRSLFAGHGLAKSFDVPYEDVVAAWRYYLLHDNHGRGVVLIGHSQGSILLQRLLAQEIEGGPSHTLLVSALLAGAPQVLVPAGATVGGTFASTPVCRREDQLGCVMAWSTYAADALDEPGHRAFARNTLQDGRNLKAVCVNPAAPAGGKATLHPVLSEAPSPALNRTAASDSGFVEFQDEASGECKDDGHGEILQVSVAAGPGGDPLRERLKKNPLPASWGLHAFDVALLDGDLSALIKAEAAAWVSQHPVGMKH